MPIDLLSRKKTHFVLWRPGASEPTPTLYIGNIKFFGGFVTMRLAAGSHVFLKRGGTQLGGFNPQRLFL